MTIIYIIMYLFIGWLFAKGYVKYMSKNTISSLDDTKEEAIFAGLFWIILIPLFLMAESLDFILRTFIKIVKGSL